MSCWSAAAPRSIRSSASWSIAEAERLVADELPVLPCFCSNVHNLLRPNVKGFVQLPYSNFADQFGAVELG